METQLHFDLSNSKQLSFKIKERITANPDLEFKVKGLLNTATGNLDYVGTLKKNFIGSSDGNSGSTPLKLGLGVKTTSSISSSKQPVHLTASAHKKYSLLDGPNTLLTAKGFVDVDPSAPQKMNRQATLKASYTAMNFTDRQDLKVAVGMDINWPAAVKDPKPTLLFQVRENNWGLHFRRNKWHVTYDL